MAFHDNVCLTCKGTGDIWFDSDGKMLAHEKRGDGCTNSECDDCEGKGVDENFASFDEDLSHLDMSIDPKERVEQYQHGKVLPEKEF